MPKSVPRLVVDKVKLVFVSVVFISSVYVQQVPNIIHSQETYTLQSRLGVRPLKQV